MALSVRTRFEVFKRDDFTCRYCGKKSPEVILEVDHVVPRVDGGTDDPMNLVTSCWACNSGKSSVPLNQVITGEDPHDKAIEMLERERQLREYNEVLKEIRLRSEQQLEELAAFWVKDANWHEMPGVDKQSIRQELTLSPAEMIRQAMNIALARGKTRDLRYVFGVLRNLREGSSRDPEKGN